EIYTLTNDTGMTAKVMTRGATLVELHVPDKDGNMNDVILGFDDVSGYESEGNQYFGCTTGRVCNRIDSGRFTLDDKNYTLAKNDGDKHHLHGGGENSLDKVVWNAKAFDSEKVTGLIFTYTSPDGEEGYPGNLSIRVIYLLVKAQNLLRIDYEATTDQRTPINLTNHMYLNLEGAGSPTVLDHKLQINADQYTVANEELIPTGEIAEVSGTPLDFRQSTRIGDRIEQLTDTGAKGYDHNYVLNVNRQDRPQHFVATLTAPTSGRLLTIHSTEPGVQLYSGNFLMGQTGKDGKVYPHRSAICLETQHYPDSVNHDDFPSTILNPGETFVSQTTYRFTTDEN
ncbi:MAG: galactose mutarotase, partial [Planctomycetaceae bacterium]|nr:galactose mutarotase [Planctomycetaceae bacterium]